MKVLRPNGPKKEKLPLSLSYGQRILFLEFFGYGPLDKPTPSLSKITYKYNSMLTYIPVSFLFSFNFRVRVRLKIAVYTTLLPGTSVTTTHQVAYSSGAAAP